MASPVSPAASRYLEAVRVADPSNAEDNCVICTESFEQDLATGNRQSLHVCDTCKLILCRGCLTRHVTANRRNSNTCPKCRGRLFEPDIETYEEDFEDGDEDSEDEEGDDDEEDTYLDQTEVEWNGGAELKEAIALIKRRVLTRVGEESEHFSAVREVINRLEAELAQHNNTIPLSRIRDLDEPQKAAVKQLLRMHRLFIAELYRQAVPQVTVIFREMGRRWPDLFALLNGSTEVKLQRLREVKEAMLRDNSADRESPAYACALATLERWRVSVEEHGGSFNLEEFSWVDQTGGADNETKEGAFALIDLMAANRRQMHEAQVRMSSCRCIIL